MAAKPRDAIRIGLAFAAAHVRVEPLLFQHSITVAGRLADLAQADDRLTHRVRDITRAALIHDLGKALLVDATLPSLQEAMTDARKRRIRRHVDVLLEYIDDDWITRYVQRQSFYPIGRLVHYSGGFLAWVVSLDAHGQPDRIRVVLNLHRREFNMNDVINRVDMPQIGHLDGPATAHEYGLVPY